MGGCCAKRKGLGASVQTEEEAALGPAPSRPVYDENGEAIEQSPDASRRRLIKAREDDLPHWEW